MGRNRLADAGEPPRFLAGKFDGTSVDWLAVHITLEQPTLRPHGPKVATKRLQQFGRQHHVTILLAFALFDTNDHSLTVNVGWLEMNSFGNSQAGGVAGRQNRPMLGAAHTTQKVEDLLRAQNHRQRLRLLRRRNDVLEGPVLLERNLVEKSQRGDGDEDGAGRQVLFIGQVNLVGPDVLGANSSGDLLK
jgi:hypothetical protein